MKWLVGSVYLLVLGGLVAMILTQSSLRKLIKKKWLTILIFLIINLVFVNAVLYLHLQQENFIAYWDFGGFWRNTLEFKTTLDASVIDALKSIYDSIVNSEYNLVAEWFLYPFIKIFGESFNSYVLSVANLFLIPTNLIVFVLGLFIQERKQQESKVLTFMIAFFIITFSSNIYPLVEGYIGCAGLPIIATITLSMVNNAYDSKCIVRSIFTGIYLLLLLLIRRWFAYYIVTFYLCWLLKFILEHLHNWNKKDITTFLVNILVCGFSALIPLLLCFNRLFITITTYNYADAYTVMQLGTEYTLWSILTWYGIVFVIIFAIGVIFEIKNKETRSYAISTIIQIVLIVFLFNRVQVFGSHHYYIIAILVMFFIIDGLIYVNKLLKKNYIIFAVCMAIIIGFNYTKTTVFANMHLDNIYRYSELLTSKALPVLRINKDTDKIVELADYLNAVSSDYEYEYVLSNSGSLNDDMLFNAYLPRDLLGVRNLIPSCAYDTRDGIPYSFFQYYYIIVADPIQLQFAADKQRCVQVLADFMLNDPRVNDYYQVVKEIQLEDGVTIKVYRRIEQVPNSIREEISQKFKSYYPDDPDLYTFEMLPE